MTEEQYGIKKIKYMPKGWLNRLFYGRNVDLTLLEVPHRTEVLTLIYPASGPERYVVNSGYINFKTNFEFSGLSFRAPTTSESISTASYILSKLDGAPIFPLQAGEIVRTSEGVFTNTSETDETKLKSFLNGVKKVNGIYLINDKIAFAPCDSFKTGVQDSGDFAEGGLARALEHTEGKTAANLREISSSKFYPEGVSVWGFDDYDEAHKPIGPLGEISCAVIFERIRDRLCIGNDWGLYKEGFLFRVLKNPDKVAHRN